MDRKSGSDMVRKTDRIGAWSKEVNEPSLFLNALIPWYPEAAGYAVCSIIEGIIRVES